MKLSLQMSLFQNLDVNDIPSQRNIMNAYDVRLSKSPAGILSWQGFFYICEITFIYDLPIVYTLEALKRRKTAKKRVCLCRDG